MRHAKAADRSSWTDPDSERPLRKAGWQQSHALGERLAAVSPTKLVSSPSLRCIQTLEPLAELTGLPIEIDDRLDEGSAFEGALELLAAVPPGTVLSSHGDVIPETIEAMIRRGLDVRGPADWRKASVWVLEREHGEFTQAVAWGPPGT